jgi:predicted dehydrogenase
VGLCPVHQFGFQHGFRRLLRERLALGDLVAVAARAASAGGEGRSGAERWQILLDMAPHYLSLFRALGGPLPAEGWRLAVATDDDLEATGRVGGMPVSFSLSLRARPRRNELLAVGTKASARIDLYHGFVAFERGGVSRSAKVIAPFRAAGGVAAAAGANLVRRFLGGEPAFPGLRGLIEAFYRSAAEGGPPPLAEGEIVETTAVLEGLEEALRRDGAA